MLTLHLLGHVQATLADRDLHLSSKSAALLAYLALERAPQPRERMARLLWGKQDALGNLRVELTRMRQQGLELFPVRTSELQVRCSTDVEHFLNAAPATGADLEGWLSQLRGPPLRGLDEVGSPEFQRWVAQRRSALLTKLGHALSVTYSREFTAGRPECAELIRTRAEAAGISTVGLLRGAGRVLSMVRQAQSEALRRALTHAGQLVVVSGRHGSGRGELVQNVVLSSGWPLVQLTAVPNRRVLQSALAQALRHLVSPGEEQLLQQVMRAPGAADEDLVRLLGVLSALGGPAVLLVHRADRAPRDFLEDLTCALASGWPLQAVLITERPTLLLRHLVGLPNVSHVPVPPLGPREVTSILHALHGADRAGVERAGAEAPVKGAAPNASQAVGLLERPALDEPEGQAMRLAQQSEGWLAYLQAVTAGSLPEPASGDAQDARRPALLPAAAGEVTEAESAQWPPDLLEALALLAVYPAALDADVARVALNLRADDPDVHALLYRAETAGLLRRAQDTETLLLPGLQTMAPDGEAPLAFVSELQRRALEVSLPTGLKRELRARLAAQVLAVRPDVCAYLAGLAGDAELAGRARRQHLASLPLHSPLRAGMSGRGVAGEPVVPPAGQPERPRQEACTGSGYRVALDGGRLEVLRLGPPVSPPLLKLRLGVQPPGSWCAVLRVDVFDGSGGAPSCRVPFPLAIGTPTARTVLVPDGAPGEYQEDGVHHRTPGAMPVGGWVQVLGEHPGGPLELTVRAAEVGLTLASLRCAERELLP